ncbi:TatD family hydrolase [Marinicellulosiphila megalodicopiae]|uniref:TatD family hydrolase n=1 Tax=Marinicellulosiphila megalodicopiae TaxID=2724896 RepID=UPI003BAFE161
MSKSNKPIPRFNTPIIETHCHLDYLEMDTMADSLDTAYEVGVEKIVTIAVSKANLSKVVEISKAHEKVYCTQGIHPHDAKDFDPEVEAIIRKNAEFEKMLAVGEIGLDYFYDHCEPDIQKAAFARQMQIADDLDLPVVIHTREACDDTAAILRNCEKTNKKRGVIHSFTSSLKLAEYCLSEGYFLGFNGIVTFNSAENVREVLSMTPLDQIVLETDAPYLTPIPYRGRPNHPKYLPFIAQKIADVKNIDVEEVLHQCYLNSEKLFFK